MESKNETTCLSYFFFPPCFHPHLLLAWHYTQSKTCCRFCFSAIVDDVLFDDSTQLPVSVVFTFQNRRLNVCHVHKMEIFRVMLHPVIPDAYKLAWESCINSSYAFLVKHKGDFWHGLFYVLTGSSQWLRYPILTLIVFWPNCIGLSSKKKKKKKSKRYGFFQVCSKMVYVWNT